MAYDRSVARDHADWLALLDISGTFLSMPVLMENFRNGLDKKENESEVRRRLRLAYDEWRDNQAGNRPDPAIHFQWLRFVLEEILEMRPDVVLEGQQIPTDIQVTKEYGERLRPTLVIRSPFEPQPRLLIQLYPHTQDLKKPVIGKQHSASDSPDTRMMHLLRNTGIRLGLVTNGQQWMLVDAPPNETTGYYTWDADIWLEEPITLRAFRSLLGMERFFNVPSSETLEAMLTTSALRQQEVTDRLGDQVRHAVEMLVQMLDRLDKDSQRALLQTLSEKDLYEAALTVMMRLVFLLSAEERDLLRLSEPLYDQNYAVSTLHKQLRELADQHGEEVLGLRFDAWSRLLAVFRIIFGGVEYIDLRLPAYGGRLFDPDRFPFLEGRKPGTSWRATPALPLLIDNRTVLHLLNALQYLQVPLPGGGVEARRLSFRGLDIEQIGHVYEGLLDHTTKRAHTTILGIIGTAKTEPETTLDTLEELARKGEQALLDYLKDTTGHSIPSLQKQLGHMLEKQEERSRLMEACDNSQALFERVQPFAGLLRKDTFGNFVLVVPGSVYVTKGSDRRSTGTHYTPRSLTEPIVEHTLDPLVYIGPAEGLPREEWQLRPAADILNLKVCDMAMGSGAFLVQSCRCLSQKLVEAWANAGQTTQALDGSDKMPRIAPEGQPSQGQRSEELLPDDPEERLALARRLVCERCLYGVDKNPMAVEMAKLSLWLITLAKNRPFTFLDHALRYGDSLLGVSERQLLNWSLDAKPGEVTQMVWMRGVLERSLATALKLRRQISTRLDLNVGIVEEKERMLKEADEVMAVVKLGGDLLVGMALSDPKRRNAIQGTLGMRYALLVKSYEEAFNGHYTETGWQPIRKAFKEMRAEVDKLLRNRQPFHWHLEFPEVFANTGDEAGFDAIIGNPPFQGGSLITGALGIDYRDYLIKYIAQGKRGNADLCAYFFLRATHILNHQGLGGLLATNTIAQGDTREVGLDQLLKLGWSIPYAIRSRKWPGTANLEVAYVWLYYGVWHGTYLLDEKPVEGINAYLDAQNSITSKPYKLITNAGKSFDGSKAYGAGFLLEPETAQLLLSKNALNQNILFPYLNGDDLNTRPDQSPSRWVINFHDWPIERAEAYAECFKIIFEKVKPEREHNNRKARRERWWQFAERAPGLYSAIDKLNRVLVVALTSKFCAFSFAPTKIVFSQATIVIAFEDSGWFAVLQSFIHLEWVIANGSTHETRQRYTPSDCFETFPFPSNMTILDDIGERYYEYRQSIMQIHQEGLTKTYNCFHDPSEKSLNIIKLRELHKEMDEAVARAYGWDDLQLEHGFHETKQGLRYTISEAARREVLDRLLLLNHQRHEEEVQVELLEKKEGKGSKVRNNGKKQIRENAGTYDLQKVLFSE